MNGFRTPGQCLNIYRFLLCAPFNRTAFLKGISWSAIMADVSQPRVLPGAIIFNPFRVGLGSMAAFLSLMAIEILTNVVQYMLLDLKF
jgi:hypothetical protein